MSTTLVGIVLILTISSKDVIMVTISMISKRYRQGFVDIDTSIMWRYRLYRHIVLVLMVPKPRRYCDEIDYIVKIYFGIIKIHVDIVTIFMISSWHAGIDIDDINKIYRYRNDIDDIVTLCLYWCCRALVDIILISTILFRSVSIS